MKVAACGVCRTDLHVVDGELTNPKVPIIPGHEIVGRIDAIGAGVKGLSMGERVGIPWLGHTCGVCPYCTGAPGKSVRSSNLHGNILATADLRRLRLRMRFAFPLGEVGRRCGACPSRCPGLIGWRSLVIAGEGKKLGLYGFGAVVHIVAQVAKWQAGSRKFAA